MRHLLLAAALAAASLLPAPAAAQVAVSLRFDLPAVLPRMVFIEPGVQVVPMVNEEVFFVDGHYWVRRDARWYRSSDHRRGWVLVEGRHVPPRLVRIPPGHYRHWDERRGYHDHDEHARAARERAQHDHDRRERERHQREPQRARPPAQPDHQDRPGGHDRDDRRDRKD